jgi:ABC-type amino acid transport substrate-binding protein
MERKFISLLTEEELQFIEDNPVIKFASENYNYPISFYSNQYSDWIGIAQDILKDISMISGLTFERATDINTTWSEMANMVLEGEVSFVTELLYTEERAKIYLMSEPYCYDYFSLLSKVSLPASSFEEIYDRSVGVVMGTVYETLFMELFPGHHNTIIFNDSDALYDALYGGHIDLAMGRNNRLLTMVNLYQHTGYKVNAVFDIKSYSRFGFNINETELQSIFDKALSVICTETIASGWIHTFYDYMGLVNESNSSIYITIAGMAGMALLFIVILLLERGKKKRGS